MEERYLYCNDRGDAGMELYQRLELFQGMISCKYSVFCWEYDAQWEVVGSSSPE